MMSFEVNINNQTKRLNSKFTLEFKQDAAKSVNEKCCAHQQAVDNFKSYWPFVEDRPRPHNPINHHTAALNFKGQVEFSVTQRERTIAHGAQNITKSPLVIQWMKAILKLYSLHFGVCP